MGLCGERMIGSWVWSKGGEMVEAVRGRGLALRWIGKPALIYNVPGGVED